MKLRQLKELFDEIENTTGYSFENAEITSGVELVKYVKLTAVFDAYGDLRKSNIMLLAGSNADYIDEELADAKNKTS